MRLWTLLLGAAAVLVGTAVGLVVFGNGSSQLAAGTATGSFVVTSITSGTVPPNGSISVSFSQPVAAGSPEPSLSPEVGGRWERSGAATLKFVPSVSFAPGESIQVTVPATLRAASGKVLGTPQVSTATIAQGSVLRLQQLLAEAGYLPVRFKPESPLASDRNVAVPQKGSFSWRWPSIPSGLAAGWYPGQWNVVTQGALMVFQRSSGLAVTGTPSATVWQALISDSIQGIHTGQPYSYIFVSKSPRPESLELYINGKVVLKSLCNTGVGIDTTHAGTWPIFERLVSATMKGVNPNGSHYVDHGVPWVSYFHGSIAVHGFVRANYGFPQSAGCVELPPAAAAQVYRQVGIGTLVTVA